MKILLVEDEKELRDTVKTFLMKEKFVVECAEDYPTAVSKINDYDYDCILLDIMLPGGSGLSVLAKLKKLRKQDSVIIISAKNSIEDKVEGLELGADDYLAKPFETRELIARVKALLRRATRKVQWVAAENPSFAGWTLDLLSRQLIDSEGVVVPLSSGEFRLLSLFLEHPQRVLSRERIMELSALKGGGIYDRSIDTQIKRLRGKLRDDGRKPSIIVTMRGDGYMLACDVTRAS